MKNTLCAALLLLCLAVSAQEKEQIIKTGLNFGPLPEIAFDADKGLQLGGQINIYNYGDGSNYPNYNSKFFFEAAYFTKGSQLYSIMYDDKVMIPGVRFSSGITATIEKAMDFYGFNGYRSYYDHNLIEAGKTGDSFLFTPYYRANRIQILGKADFIGDINDKLKWEAGYHASWFKEGEINRESINKGKDEGKAYPDALPTLFEEYLNWGLITPEEADGGFTSSLRLGLVYDTRDKEGAPSSGIWAEGHLIAAPKWLGTTNPFTRYSLTWRHYLPLVKNNILTFAYRINYEGTLGESAPYYVLPFITVMGENMDKDGMGGYRTTRGIMRDRVIGLDMASYNAEMRWRFTHFSLGKQNIALGLSAFSDGTMVTRGRDMSFKGDALYKPSYDAYMAKGLDKDKFHITAGAGFRFIMNENFIIAFEYGAPISHFVAKTNPIYNQDGTGAFYINTGYLF